MPGEETVFGREARNGKDFDGFVGQEWRQRRGSDPRITESQCWNPDGLALVIAQRAVRADELADAMSAAEAVRLPVLVERPLDGSRASWRTARQKASFRGS